jgi:DNA-binding SARP family transcriptional activator/ATP/maltotriose-dependent transcriptional regulator MalT
MSAPSRRPTNGVHSVGSRVRRTRILSVLERLLPCPVYCVAPAGYGKTSLATQIAALEIHHDVFWVDCHGEQMTSEGLLERTMSALVSECESVHTQADSADWSLADAVAQISSLLSRHAADGAACLILDDIRIDSAQEGLNRLLECAHRSDRPLTMILTCRDMPSGSLDYVRDFVSVGPEDLTLDSSEAASILTAVGGQQADPGLVSALLANSGGQAALFSVLARHHLLSGRPEPESLSRAHDIQELLLSLARNQLSAAQMEILFAIAILGSASRSELGDISTSAPDMLLDNLATCIPLVKFDSARHSSGDTLCAHAIAQDVYGTRAFVESFNGDHSRIFRACLRVLERRADYGRALRVISLHADQEYLASWLQSNGQTVGAQGFGIPLREALESLHPSILLRRPRLLLQLAGLLADQGEGREAAAKAAVSRDLAMCEGDYSVVADALIKLAEIQLDLGELAEACASLNELLALPRGSVADAQRSVTMSYLCAFLSVFMEHEEVQRLEERLRDALEHEAMTAYQESRIYAQLAIAGVMFGRISTGIQDLQAARRTSGLPVALQVMIEGNLATLFMETGKLGLAAEMCDHVLGVTEDSALRIYNACFSSAYATIRFSQGDEQAGIALADTAIKAVKETGDPVSEAFCRAYLATTLRASGDLDRSMTEVERVLELVKAPRLTYFETLAEVELAAGFLALGDYDAAVRYATRVREACMNKSADYHLMRADMVLAEIARREGLETEALARLLEHEEYILSENPNWSIAMYIRAFPHLLGLFAAALGPERLPTHMLRMITGHHVDEALSAARKTLEEAEWQTLAFRMLGEEGADRIAALSTTAPCRVRLFGGLDVSVGTRQVLERDWRKRKARLLFAMLVLQQGREVPREQIYDHLWPEMDADRSRNNFYVIWSSMKGALVPDSAKGEACPYVEHTGGVCKVVPEHVFSDVAEFDVLVSAARQDVHAKDTPSAIRNYERLIDLYRGDLLPGDVYDDWFSSARDRYRQEFCDAMLTAHRLLTEVGDHPGALRMVRRGIVTDPWREDLYQAALRSHISSGQRSAAIDTYLSCRAHLADQLGLDPSTETMHLYEQVLAMEERSDGNSITG